MVVLPTPARTATASMDTPATPGSRASRSRVASRIAFSARSLRGRPGPRPVAVISLPPLARVGRGGGERPLRPRRPGAGPGLGLGRGPFGGGPFGGGPGRGRAAAARPPPARHRGRQERDDPGQPGRDVHAGSEGRVGG